MTTSRVPAALTALVSICSTAPSLTGATVIDGPPITDLSKQDLVFIGWSPNQETAVALQQSFNAAGARTRDEQFDIFCYAEHRSGDTDIPTCRTAAFALLAAVEQALRATEAAPTAPTLNGTVQWAHLTAGNLTQAQAQSGAVVGVEFTISCRARI